MVLLFECACVHVPRLERVETYLDPELVAKIEDDESIESKSAYLRGLAEADMEDR